MNDESGMMGTPQMTYHQQMQGSPVPQMQGVRAQSSYLGGPPVGMMNRMMVPNILKQPPIGPVPQPSSPPTSVTTQQQQQQQQHQQQQQPKEMNTASLYRLGQETVQEIVNKTTEMFQFLKQVQLPTGSQQSLSVQKERKEKVQEHLHNIGLLFKRLRLIYDKCNENCAGMEYTHIESLIPLKDEVNSRPEERKLTETMKFASEEHREIADQVIQRSKHLKEIIDHLRSIIWEVNTMLATRKP